MITQQDTISVLPTPHTSDCFSSDSATLEQIQAWRTSLAMREGFGADDGFHMYYTSGTTGLPKGVLLSHRIVMLHALGTAKGGS